MENRISIEQKLEQKIKLTQEMKMSIEILKLNSSELLEYVVNESQSNPAIDSDHMISQVEKLNENYDLPSLIKYLDTPGDDYINYRQSENNFPEFNFSEEPSLTDYLMEQLGFLKLSKFERKAGEYIIYSLDEWGYFRQTTEEAARNLKLNKNVVETALDKIRSLDPPGIAAGNLSECLIIQLVRNGVQDSILLDIVSNDLEAIGLKQTELICDKYGITTEKLDEYLSIIRHLNPKPSSGFSTDGEPTVFIIPDADITFDENGEAIVRLNDEIIPEIRISDKYIELIESVNKNEREALKKYVNRALYIARFIEKRNHTLRSVIYSIVNEEKDFLRRRSDNITPLTLCKIAEKNELSISTISRAVRGKHINTPMGIISIRDFFQRHIKQSGGDIFSKDYIQDKILRIINNENKQKPYSDSVISNILKSEGIEIKRRTVAKYREEMNVGNASQRRIQIDKIEQVLLCGNKKK